MSFSLAEAIFLAQAVMTPAPVAFPNSSLRHLSVHLQSETFYAKQGCAPGIDEGARFSAKGIPRGVNAW
ncbi:MULTISPECIES: hypothetical protein [Bradyrhizobium]|uniref:hypothetical protein n=1 Tax=Bradyrhizobium TaxID=374 RepID=UPI00115FE690|nr:MULTISPECIES: hypothetical protein [Bradyrhizobium]